MLGAITLILSTALTVGEPPARPPLIVRGGDPARGVLVNRTVGSRPFDPPVPTLPSVVFVPGFNPAPRIVHFEMAARLAEAMARRGARCNVLEWDWNAATCDSLIPRTNSENSVAQGRLLAAHLALAGLDPGRIHLIGHSAGGMVVTSAASVCASEWGRPIAQLTLLDPATYYHKVIFQRLRAGSLAPLVENYWTASPSAYGNEVRLPGVLDYHVAGHAFYLGVVCPIRSDHVSIVIWYLETIADPNRPGGFNTNRWIERPGPVGP